MAKAKKSEQLQEEAPMDMTPMIDCVFLLIIFFLCIDFKVLEAKLPAYLPKDVGAQPTKVEPQDKVQVEIYCDDWGTAKKRRENDPNSSVMLIGHKVRYVVGPKPIADLRELGTFLKKIAEDPTKMQRDPKTGQMKRMGVVVEPRPKVCYGDVAAVVDVVTNAGFTEINFGGGMGSKDQPRK